MNNKEASKGQLFEIGNKLPEIFSKNFSGEAYLNMLVPSDSELNCPIGYVTFEPDCRNNWHKHPGGQILLVTEGRGYYQEKNQQPRELNPGDVVMISPNVVHWHCAASDSWFSHISIETNCQEGEVQWLGPVDEVGRNA